MRSAHLGAGTLACPRCDVPVALAGRRASPAEPLGFPFCVLLGIVALMTFFSLPPFGGFLDDYERASLERGVNVPRYLEEQGLVPPAD